MAIEIRVPTLGESVTEATVGKWFKKAGDAVKADEPLVELETDKVTLEVPAPASGIMGDDHRCAGHHSCGWIALGLSKRRSRAGDSGKDRKGCSPRCTCKGASAGRHNAAIDAAKPGRAQSSLLNPA